MSLTVNIPIKLLTALLNFDFLINFAPHVDAICRYNMRKKVLQKNPNAVNYQSGSIFPISLFENRYFCAFFSFAWEFLCGWLSFFATVLFGSDHLTINHEKKREQRFPGILVLFVLLSE